MRVGNRNSKLNETFKSDPGFQYNYGESLFMLNGRIRLDNSIIDCWLAPRAREGESALMTIITMNIPPHIPFVLHSTERRAEGEEMSKGEREREGDNGNIFRNSISIVKSYEVQQKGKGSFPRHLLLNIELICACSHNIRPLSVTRTPPRRCSSKSCVFCVHVDMVFWAPRN